MDCPDNVDELLTFWGRDPEHPAFPALPEPPLTDDQADAMLDDEPVGLPPASHDAIKRAAKRWSDFVAVTQGLSQEEVTERGYVFAAALGLEGGKLDHAVECLKAWTDDPSPHQATMGLLFGLLIADETKLERELEGPEVG